MSETHDPQPPIGENAIPSPIQGEGQGGGDVPPHPNPPLQRGRGITSPLAPPLQREGNAPLPLVEKIRQRLDLIGLRAISPPLAIIGLGLALYGQAQIYAEGGDKSGYGWFLALGALYVGIGLADVALEREAQAEADEEPWLWPLGLAGGAMGLLSYQYFKENTFTPLGTALWLGGLLAFLMSFGAVHSLWRGLQARVKALQASPGMVIPWTGLALLAILLIALVLRFDRLDTIPGEMGEDLPHNYENARAILNGEFSIFFPSHPGREGLMFYLQALYGRVFGLSYYGLKATSAIIGILTVALMYVVVRGLFNAEAGLYAALFLAISRWHVTASRMGLRLILMPLFVLMALGLLGRALRSRRRLDFALLGLVAGLGLHTYNAWMVMPFAVVGSIVAYEILVRREAWTLGRARSILYNIAIMVFTATLVFIPLARYAHDYPEVYGQRVASRLAGSEAPLPENVPMVFLDNLKRSALMFNVEGDHVARYNVPFMPQLGVVSGALFLAGVAWALARWRRGINLVILLLLLATILPPALAIAFPGEVPNAGRGSGAIAPAYVLVALPLALLRRRLAKTIQSARSLRLVSTIVSEAEGPHTGRRFEIRLTPAILLIPLMVAGFALMVVEEAKATVNAYFIDYPEQMNLRNFDLSGAIAREIDRLWPNGPVYTVIYPYWYDGNAVRAQLRVAPHDWQNELWPDNLSPDRPPLAGLQGKAAFIVHPSDRRSIQVLQQVFPKGVMIALPDNSGGIAFYTFIGER